MLAPAASGIGQFKLQVCVYYMGV